MKINFNDIKVQTKRLIIRPLKASDYDCWFKAYTNRKEKTYKYDGAPVDSKKITKKWFNDLIKKHQRIASEDKIYVFGVFNRKTNEHIGSLDFATIQRYNMNWANLGYAVHNNHQKMGYAQEFVSAGIKEIAYKKLKYKRIEAAINLDNKPSVKLAKSVGMNKECIRPQFFFENGDWVDHVVYTAISNDKKFYEK